MNLDDLNLRYLSGDLKTFKPYITQAYQQGGEPAVYDLGRAIDETIGANAFELYSKEYQEIKAANLSAINQAAINESKNTKAAIDLQRLQDSLTSKANAASISTAPIKSPILPEKTNGLITRTDLIGPQRGDETGAFLSGGEKGANPKWAIQAKNKKIAYVLGGILLILLIIK